MPDRYYEDVSLVCVKASRSKRQVYYGPHVVLHETSKKRIEFVPFFIRHKTKGTSLAIKILVVAKKEGVETVRKFQSLNQSAAHALLQKLREHVAIAAQNEDGSFLVIRTSDGDADVSSLDTSKVAAAVASLLRKKDIVQHLTAEDLGTEIVPLVRGAIRIKQLRCAIGELRICLEKGISDEKIYEDWCKQHSWAFGLGYLPADDVRNITASDRLDLILPCIMTEYRDMVELKRPDVEVLHYDNGHRNFYFSSDVSKVIGQCHRYLDTLYDYAKNGLLDHPEIIAYHPRITIVIGRSVGWTKDKLKAFHGLNRRLIDIDIITYDHLLAQGERLIQILSAEPEVELEAEDLPF